LSILLPGLGQVYSNKAKRGFVFLAIDIVAGLIFFAYVINPYTPLGIVIIVPALGLIAFGIYILVDSYRCAAGFNASNNLSRNTVKGNRVWIILGIIFLVIGFNPVPFFTSYYIRKNIVQTFKTPTGSMQPTLLPGDAIFVDNGIYKKSDPARGDVVVFILPQDKRKVFVKRIVGLPGETLQIKDGKILINTEPLTESVIAKIHYENRGEFGDYGKSVTIPGDSFYLLGDNSMSSADSRFWGFVPRQNILGKAFKIYFPFDRSGLIK
jgi:signal peptidase I